MRRKRSDRAILPRDKGDLGETVKLRQRQIQAEKRQRLTRNRRRRNEETANGRRPTAGATVSEKSPDQDTKAAVRVEDPVEKLVEKLLALRSVRDQAADAGFDLSSSQGSQLKAMEARLVYHFVAERRLREGMDQVTAAVVGDFNSGKSTFINALLQDNLCPTGDEPTTSSVTYFFHGDQTRIEQVEPSGTRKRLTRESYDELVRHRKQGDQVPAVFHISLPSQILEHVRIVDTPGFDAPPPNSNDTEGTEHGVAESDVLFVLMDASKGNPSKALLEQLQRMQQSPAADRQKPMFLLINKAEEKPPRQRDMMRKENREKYQALFRVVEPISAKLLMNQEDEEGLMSLSTLRSKMVELAKERHTIAERQFQRSSTRIREALVGMNVWLSDTIERRERPLVFDENKALDKIDESLEVIVGHMDEMRKDMLESAFIDLRRKKETFWSFKVFVRTGFRRQRNAVHVLSAGTRVCEVLKTIMDELKGLGFRLPIQTHLPEIRKSEIRKRLSDSIKSVDDKFLRILKAGEIGDNSWSWDKKESCWIGTETETDDAEHETDMARDMKHRYKLLLIRELAYFPEFIRGRMRELVVSFAASNRAQSDQRSRELQLLRERIGILRKGLE